MATNPTKDDEEAVKPDTGTTEDENSDTSPKSQPEVDYKLKFAESSKEALRLKELADKQAQELAASQEVMDVLYQNPELLKQVQSAYQAKITPDQSTDSEPGTIATKVQDHKLREAVKPIQETVEKLQQERNQELLTTFLETYPDVAPGTPKADAFLQNLQIMGRAGVPFKEGLKKAYELTTVDEVRRTGKVDAIKAIFEKQSAAAGSGTSSAPKSTAREAELSTEQRKVAQALGLKEEDYAKNLH